MLPLLSSSATLAQESCVYRKERYHSVPSTHSSVGLADPCCRLWIIGNKRQTTPVLILKASRARYSCCYGPSGHRNGRAWWFELGGGPGPCGAERCGRRVGRGGAGASSCVSCVVRTIVYWCKQGSGATGLPTRRKQGTATVGEQGGALRSRPYTISQKIHSNASELQREHGQVPAWGMRRGVQGCIPALRQASQHQGPRSGNTFDPPLGPSGGPRQRVHLHAHLHRYRVPLTASPGLGLPCPIPHRRRPHPPHHHRRRRHRPSLP